MTEITKPVSKRERNVRKALQRSLRNNPPLTPNAKLNRKQRRLQARLTAKVTVPKGDLSTLSVKALRERAKEAGVKGYSRMTKDEIVTALETI